MIGHAGDALSALVDGQLSLAEATAVRAHVDDCGQCAAELDDVRQARRMLRSLPAVDPPAEFLDALLSDADAGDGMVLPLRARRTAPLAAVASSVAAGLILLALAASTLTPAAIDPGLDTAVEKHTSTVGALEAGGQLGKSAQRFVSPASVPPTTAEPRAADELPAPFDAPAELAGYDLVEAYEMYDGVHLLYRRGPYGLSIFQWSGEIDWSTLPDNGTRLRVAGHDAWRWDELTAEGRLYVVEDDGMVVMLVGDEPGDAVLDAAAALPSARSPSMKTRVRRTVAKALELFSPMP
jgi:anti-sigma factor RsiW